MWKIENGVYFDSNGNPAHEGVVEVDGKIYYAGKNGVIAKNEYRVIHHGMSNGLVKHGSYYFDHDGVIDLSTFVPPKKSTKKKRRSSKTKLSKKHKIIGITLSLVLTFSMIAGVAVLEKFVNEKPNSGRNTQFEIVLPEYTDEVYLCSDAMIQYYQGTISLQDMVERNGDPYKPFVFTYSIKNASSATFKLINDQDDSTVVFCDLDTDLDLLSIDNLMTDTTYKYIVTSVDLDGKEHINEGSFKTADTNRFISLPGVYNTRDIGGYHTTGGKKVKQGLLIRGTELDGLVKTEYYLSDLESVEPFGFKCDFDLRNSDIFNARYTSRLGKKVIHKFYDSPMYGGIFSVKSRDSLKQIFHDLADASNYPMYLHCTLGADRTGTIIFLLQGVLGVSEEDMKAEYELTGFLDKSYVYGENIDSVLSGLQGTSGNNVNKKIENFLVNTIGVTQNQLNNIRSIFLD